MALKSLFLPQNHKKSLSGWRLCPLSPQAQPGQLTANQQFRHSDLLADFATVISSQSEGLGQMALGIVKYAYDRSSQLIGFGQDSNYVVRGQLS